MITVKISKRKLLYILTTILVTVSVLLGSGTLASPQVPSVQQTQSENSPPTGTTYTLATLTAYAKADTTYSGWTFAQWDLHIRQLGLDHMDDGALATFVNGVPAGINQANTQLGTLILPNAVMISSINSQVATLQTQRNALQTTLDGIKANAVSSKETLAQQQNDPNIQQAANNVAAVDGQINTVSQPLQIQPQITELNRWIASTYDNFASAIQEQSYRAQGTVHRTYVHSTYYMDFTAKGTVLTNTYSFVNGSPTVSASGHPSVDSVVANDYIQTTGGTEWYKVSSVDNVANTVTLTINFQQASTGAAAAYAALVSTTYVPTANNPLSPRKKELRGQG